MDTYTAKLEGIETSKEISKIIDEALTGRTDLMLQLGNYFSELYDQGKLLEQDDSKLRKSLLSAVHWLELWYKGTDREKHDIADLLDLSRLYESLGMNRESLEILLGIKNNLAIYTKPDDSENHSESENLNYVNYALGTMYMDGIGCEKNHKKSLDYFVSVDFLGSYMRASARYNMARIYIKMGKFLDAIFFANTAKAIGHPDLDGILDKELITSIYEDSNKLSAQWMDSNYPVTS